MDETCVSDGARDGDCHECRSAESPFAWSVVVGRACDDGDPCTFDDRCGDAAVGCAGEPYSCDDGLECTEDVCLGTAAGGDSVGGACDFVPRSSTCLIDGECWGADERNPADPCRACRPDRALDEWVAVDDGTVTRPCWPCEGAGTADEGRRVVGEQQCVGGAWSECGGHVCPGPETCDGVDDDCDGATDEDFPLLGTPCDGPDGDGCANGSWQCRHDGADVACANESPVDIAERCDGEDNDCDGETDEDFPLVGDACDGDDADDCANGTFTCTDDGAKVECVNEFGPIGEEVCNGIDDDCDGATDEDGSALCDDGIPCTENRCGVGGCEFPIADGFCLIDGECHVTGDVPPDAPCLACSPADAAKAWSFRAGLRCTDGNPCTREDVCVPDAGGCDGTPYDCADGFACTLDACNGDGTCANPIGEGFCLIDGACRTRGDERPGDPCRACRDDWGDPYATTWAVATDGTPCGAGGICEEGRCRPLAWCGEVVCPFRLLPSVEIVLEPAAADGGPFAAEDLS